MNYLKSVIIFFSLSMCFGSFSKRKPDSCQEHYKNRQWKKAEISCELRFTKDRSTHKPLYLLNYLVKINAKLDNRDNEGFYLYLMKNHPEFSSDLVHQYSWYRRMGQIAFYKFNYSEAREYYQKSYDAAVRLNDEKLQSESYNDLGDLYKNSGDYLKAIKYYQNSLTLNLMLNDDNITANTYAKIGSFFLKLEKPTESIEYLLQAIKYYQKIDEIQSQAMITHVHEDLSMAYLKSGQDEKAKFYINKIIASNEVRTTKEEQSNATLALSKYYNQEGKPKKAQALLKQTLFDHKPMYCLQTNLEIAKNELELGNTTNTNCIALNGLKVAKNNEDIFYQFNFNYILSQSMEQTDPKRALKYLKDYLAAREVFLNNKYNSKINKVEYEIKKHKFDKNLLTEQLISNDKQKRILTLSHRVLMGFLFLLLMLMAWAFYIYKKNKQKQIFIDQLKYHKDQLELLNASQQKKLIDAKATKVITKQDFKEALIKAMVDVVDVWNRHTGENKIDLAEKSKVWTVTVDNGTLRTRSMDKYLSLKNIPANPRWRKVVRTCHFVLSDRSLKDVDRALLNANVNQIMQVINTL